MLYQTKRCIIMWKCPNCHTLNNGDKCGSCGNLNPNADTGANYSQNPSQNSANYNPYPVGANWAPPAETPVMPTPAPTKSKSNTLLIVCIVLMSIIIAVMIFAATVLITQKSFIQNHTDKRDTVTVDSDDSTWQEEDNDLPTKENESEEATENEEEPTQTPSTPKPKDSGKKVYDDFDTYTNSQYNFYCAYPTEFNSTSPQGINAVKSYTSPDGNATMTIRACPNPNGITIDAALNDFFHSFGGVVTKNSKGDDWYVVSINNSGKSHYRKCLIKEGNIYCVDFEYNTEDSYRYEYCIENIENNFDTM